MDHIKKLRELEQIAESTLITYSNFLKRLMRYLLEYNKELTIGQFNQAIFLDFLLTDKSEKIEILATRTINTYTAIVRELLDFCYYSDLTDKQYEKRFAFKPVDLKPRYFSEEEVVAFLKSALQTTHGYRYHALFSFLLGSGCRVSEVSKLRVCDFDIENNVIRIYKGKGNKDRNIPIYPQVKKIVLDYLFLTGVNEWSRDLKGFLFSRDYGTTREKPISVRSIGRMVLEICKKLKLSEHFTAHSFRHTFAVRCLLAKMRTEYLSQILGHKSPETTYIYIQLFPRELQEHVSEKYPFAFEQLLFTSTVSASRKEIHQINLLDFTQFLCRIKEVTFEEVHLEKIFTLTSPITGNVIKHDPINYEVLDHYFKNKQGFSYNQYLLLKNSIGAFFKFLEKEYHFASPVRLMEFNFDELKPVKRPVKILSRHDILRFLHTLVSESQEYHRDLTMFCLIFSTGCRISEILSLRKDQINFTYGLISVIFENIVYYNNAHQTWGY
ncbi:tyrosine-type recombinase/integrase [Paenibacillus sp. N3.4]|uniref:tyrosine-type recombinase/integrase n=1 Tax=Paenibacillus sp. N3.4 TaxID=2603222 RepID=UPI0011CC1A95|nr:tyrosine-type recombinase/integrase [Paenibacillus sp. N3.4]TXK72257.1 tyrosine-type recombinase/integrase [Paenibacillus sp. N3.4]